MMGLDPKFPNSIPAAIVVNETALPMYSPGRVLPLSMDRGGALLVAINGAIAVGAVSVIDIGGWIPLNVGDDADGKAVVSTGDLQVLARNTGFNGTTWDRLRSTGDNADAVAVATLGELLTLARNTGFNGTTWDRLRTLVSNADAQTAAVTGLQGVVARLTGFNGTTFDRLASAGDNADAVVVATLGELLTLARNSLFNGRVWDRARGNTDETVLASAARTATTNSADQTNYNARGVHVLLNVTVVPGVDTVTLSIQGKDLLSGAYYTLLTGPAVVATGMNVYKVFPGITAVANGTASDVLPRTWRVSVTHSAATSFTYSVGAALVI